MQGRGFLRYLRMVVLQPESASGLVWNMVLGLASSISDAVGPRQGLKMCISTAFLGGAEPALPGLPCGNHHLRCHSPQGSEVAGAPSWWPHSDSGTQGEREHRLLGIPILEEVPGEAAVPQKVRKTGPSPSPPKSGTTFPPSSHEEPLATAINS